MILGSSVDALTQLGGHNYSHVDKRAAPTLRLLDTPMTGLRTGSLDAPPTPTPAPLSAAEAHALSKQVTTAERPGTPWLQREQKSQNHDKQFEHSY